MPQRASDELVERILSEENPLLTIVSHRDASGAYDPIATDARLLASDLRDARRELAEEEGDVSPDGIIEHAANLMERAADQRTGAAIYFAVMVLTNLDSTGNWRLLNDAVSKRWPSPSGPLRVKKAAWAMHSRCAKVRP